MADDKEIEYAESKRVSEALRVITPLFLNNQTGMKKNVAPFFIIVVVMMFTVYDWNLGKGIEIADKINLFSNTPFAMPGITIYEPRRFVVAAMASALWVMFVRFGFLYYQSIDTTTYMKKIIGKEKEEDIRKGYRNAIKDAYVVDALLVFFPAKTDNPVDTYQTDKVWKSLVSGLVIVGFVFFIVVGQYLTMAVASAIIATFAIPLLLFYIIFYCLFYFKLDGLKDDGRIEEGIGTGIIMKIFAGMMIFGSCLNVWAMIQYYDTGRYSDPQKVAFAGKIPIKKFLVYSPVESQVFENYSGKPFIK